MAVTAIGVVAVTSALVLTTVQLGPSASAAAPGARAASAGSSASLPAPPAPPTPVPQEPTGFHAPTALVGTAASAVGAAIASSKSVSAMTAAAVTPPQAFTWGSGSKSTLVLYDTTGQYGYLGELYAEGAGNLASHFGSVTAEPVIDYQSGQISRYSATLYIGSTYNEPLPLTFLNDALSTTTPVLWMGDNIWQLSGTGAADTAFQATYGWDPLTSYFDSVDTVGTVAYNGQTFTRNTLNGPILAPHITSTTTPSLVTQLAQANCESTTLVAQACNSVAQAPGGAAATSYPWAIQSANLTYLGEIPLSYINETDRYVAFSGLLFNVLDPTAAPSHQALVRLEDLSPADDPTVLVEIAQYLHSVNVPFSMNVISDYVDPAGVYNNGVPVIEPLDGTDAASVAFVAALKQMMALGGTLNMEGSTHQYTATGATVTDNPYTGVSGDDFEFYRAQCSSTASPPYIFDTSCPTTDHVIEEGPVPEDSASWADGRINASIAQFTGAGLPTPQLFIFPHYAASSVDYQQLASIFPSPTSGAYDRRLYFGGALTPGASTNYSQTMGQFFPYSVHDLYGTTVVPENLGDYEPTAMNGNPIRNAAGIIAEAQDNLAVTQGTASFFFDPDYFTNNDPTGVLQTVVSGIQGLGYTFVSPVSVLQASNLPPAIKVTTTSLPGATAGTPYTADLAATGGTGTTYTWTVATGSLPAGLSLSSAGVISGTPTTAGASSVSVTATDTASASGTSPPLTLVITATPPLPPPALTVMPIPAPVPTPAPSGYDLVGSDGGVFAFGGGFYGSLPGIDVHVNNVVGIVPSSDKLGYLLVGSDGGVFSFGDTNFYGSLPGRGVRVNDIVGIVPTIDDRGYFLVGRDGGVFAFGDARFEDSLPGIGIHVTDVTGIAATSGGNGYWLVGSSGAVYSFGDAHFYGRAAAGAVGITATHDGGGYWVVGTTGAVSIFGNASAFGNLPALGVSVNDIVGIVPTSAGQGYFLAGQDGGVFSFGDAAYIGSLPGLGVHVDNVVGAVPT